MKITSLSAQVKNPNRINVSLDGKYRFSLDINQIIDLGIKVGRELSEQELEELENEGQFSKLYARTLEYTLMRPHSAKEVRDYLWRKTRATKYKSRTGDIKEREGVPISLTDRVFDRLLEKGYIDDEKFAKWWIENRNLTKGSSRRKLVAELRSKGVQPDITESLLTESDRSDESEIQKMIAKKRSKYDDEQKLIAYLARQGFSYDDIKSALLATDDQ